MKKTLLVTCAALVAVCQFGCGGTWGIVHDVVAHLLAVGWTADMLNLIP
ncbi:MAG TPA: hypothetical protein VLM89_06755 [Phycisphaerae bacterium]|nr:hypothetical protein [Phycisphaerae bacterium]